MNGADSPKVGCRGRESHTLLRGTASQEPPVASLVLGKKSPQEAPRKREN